MADKAEILVVEDDVALNRLVCCFIEIAGYSARAVLDGGTALREAQDRPPRLVLLDLMLPDTTGFEVCQKLKRDHRTSAVPVIIVTALTDNDSRRRGMECGASAYLTKPFEPDHLVETIRKHAA